MKRISLVGAALTMLILLVAFFLARFNLHRPSEVVLAEPSLSEEVGVVVSGMQKDQIQRVEVTPETVQLVIRRLRRPGNYSCVMQVERFWQGGSVMDSVQVRSADGCTRLDLSGSGESRHVVAMSGSIIDAESDTTYIWYENNPAYFSSAAALSADEEEGVPTYEDILLLDPAKIASADYRVLNTEHCIYVETVPDEFGYFTGYWISVDSGLLYGSTYSHGEDLLVRVICSQYEVGSVTAEAFTLPDGTVLYDPAPGRDGGEIVPAF